MLLMPVNRPAAVAAAELAAGPPTTLFLLPPVASTSRLIDTEDVTGVHTLPQAPLQLVQTEPLLLLLLLLLALAAAAAAAVAAAMLAAAGVMPHMSGGGLGPCLAL